MQLTGSVHACNDVIEYAESWGPLLLVVKRPLKRLTNVEGNLLALPTQPGGLGMLKLTKRVFHEILSFAMDHSSNSKYHH